MLVVLVRGLSITGLTQLGISLGRRPRLLLAVLLSLVGVNRVLSCPTLIAWLLGMLMITILCYGLLRLLLLGRPMATIMPPRTLEVRYLWLLVCGRLVPVCLTTPLTAPVLGAVLPEVVGAVEVLTLGSLGASRVLIPYVPLEGVSVKALLLTGTGVRNLLDVELFTGLDTVNMGMHPRLRCRKTCLQVLCLLQQVPCTFLLLTAKEQVLPTTNLWLWTRLVCGWNLLWHPARTRHRATGRLPQEEHTLPIRRANTLLRAGVSRQLVLR